MKHQAALAGISILLLATCSSYALAGMSTPQCTVKQEDSSIWKFTITKDRTEPDVAWSDVTIVMEDTHNHRVWQWSQLDPPESGTQSLASEGGGTPSLVCNVTDILSKGYLNSGDFFTIEPNGTGFDPASVDELALAWEPTAEPMWTGEFRNGELVAPFELPWMLVGLAGVVGICVVVVLFIIDRKKKGRVLTPVQKSP